MTVYTERSEKWVRAYVGETAVVDSRAPMIFKEPAFPLPWYAFTEADVRRDLLRPAAGAPPTEPSFFLPLGPVAQWFDLEVEGRVIPHAAWVRDDPALRDRYIFSWQPGVLDRWMEEDEEVHGHPRDPRKRVEAIASRRQIEISANGVDLASSASPVLLFETDLPIHFYLPREDVDFGALTASANSSHCPYKGDADEYWDAGELRNVAWSYAAPYRAVGNIAGMVAFYNEIVDVTIDGVPQARPDSVFSDPANRPS